MIGQNETRINPKRRAVLGPRHKQFATTQWQEHSYSHRLNFYSDPPTADITLEQFEQWAIDRLRGLSPLRSIPTPNPPPKFAI